MSDHIEVSNLKNFMLGQHKLNEDEEAHLLRCKQCMTSMTEATLAHLRTEDEDKER